MINYTDSVQKGLQDEFRIINILPHYYLFFNVFTKIYVNRLNRLFSHLRGIRANNYDIFHIIDHSYSHLLMYVPRKTVSIVTVHDIIPILISKKEIGGIASRGFPLFFKFSMLWLKKANYIVAVSQTTKNDVVNFLGISPDKINVIHNSVSPLFRLYSDEERQIFSYKYNFNSRNFNVIIFSNGEFYKNTKNALMACERVNCFSDIKVTVHSIGYLVDELKEFVNISGLKTFEYTNLSTIEMALLYNYADVLLFPSFYEGFGLPLIESMACGTPVISSERGAIPEISEGNVIYCNPESVYSIAEKLLFLFNNEEVGINLVSRGLEISKKYTGIDLSREYAKIYSSLND